ncbi:hypothetical protein CRG98_031987 [Punica granatum]|uniref:Uncharacterized protein n=1 Tax=Punica granatum TaxID=22663 RepID=A0A2I0IUC3_PUNGR|nr:hypothetical protein CRG98_031987 [Punica granatum]
MAATPIRGGGGRNHHRRNQKSLEIGASSISTMVALIAVTTLQPGSVATYVVAADSDWGVGATIEAATPAALCLFSADPSFSF